MKYLYNFLQVITTLLLSFIITFIYFNQATNEYLIIISLSITLILNIIIKIYKIGRNKEYSKLPLIPIISYLIVYPISAFVHFLPENTLKIYDVNSQFSHISLYSIVIVIIAYYSLILGLGNIRSNLIPHQLTIKKKTSNSSFIFLGFSIFSFLMFMSFGFSLFEIYRGDNQAGIAKYIFMTSWLSISLTMIISYYLLNGTIKNKYTTFFVIISFTIIAIVSVFWNGARLRSLISILPSLIVFYRIKPILIKKISIGILSLVVLNIIYTTFERIGNNEITKKVLLYSVFDWQVGRFSMVELAVYATNVSGYEYIDTFFFSIKEIWNTFFGFTGLILKNVSTNSYSGLLISDDRSINSWLVGSICDVYFNFGIIGIVVLFYLLGKLMNIIIQRAVNSRDISLYYSYIYILCLISLFTIPGLYFSWMLYLFTSGAPILYYLLNNIPKGRKY